MFFCSEMTSTASHAQNRKVFRVTPDIVAKMSSVAYVFRNRRAHKRCFGCTFWCKKEFSHSSHILKQTFGLTPKWALNSLSGMGASYRPPLLPSRSLPWMMKVCRVALAALFILPLLFLWWFSLVIHDNVLWMMSSSLWNVWLWLRLSFAKNCRGFTS